MINLINPIMLRMDKFKSKILYWKYKRTRSSKLTQIPSQMRRARSSQTPKTKKRRSISTTTTKIRPTLKTQKRNRGERDSTVPLLVTLCTRTTTCQQLTKAWNSKEKVPCVGTPSRRESEEAGRVQRTRSSSISRLTSRISRSRISYRRQLS